MTTTRARATAPHDSKTGIERIIEDLYAAGLNLEVMADRRDLTPSMTAVLPDCVRRISELMTDLSEVAGDLPPDPFSDNPMN